MLKILTRHSRYLSSCPNELDAIHLKVARSLTNDFEPHKIKNNIIPEPYIKAIIPENNPKTKVFTGITKVVLQNAEIANEIVANRYDLSYKGDPVFVEIVGIQNKLHFKVDAEITENRIIDSGIFPSYPDILTDVEYVKTIEPFDPDPESGRQNYNIMLASNQRAMSYYCLHFNNYKTADQVWVNYKTGVYNKFMSRSSPLRQFQFTMQRPGVRKLKTSDYNIPHVYRQGQNQAISTTFRRKKEKVAAMKRKKMRSVGAVFDEQEAFCIED